MEEALAKIRPHTSSSLAHQKTPANLLIAIENTFQEQHTESTPTAYFAAILTTLDSTIQKKDLSLQDGAVLPAELYLLALVAPFLAIPVIRSNLSTLLSLTSPLFPLLHQHPPALRSQLSLYLVIFRSLDRSQLEAQGVRQTFASVLQMSIDPRPKVRKRAADIVKEVLTNPPTPLVRHPYAAQVAESLNHILAEVNAGPFAKGKASKQGVAPGVESAIHALAFLRPIVGYLPPASLPLITNHLLTLPRLGNPYLSQSCYSIMSVIFTASIDDASSDIKYQLTDVLRVVLSFPPSKSDVVLSASWVQALGSAFIAYNAVDQAASSEEFLKVWKSVWNFLDSTDVATRKMTAQSLCALSSCFSPALASAAILDQDGSSIIRKIISQITKALDSLAYARLIPELLSIISSIITNLRYRDSKMSPTAAELLILPLIVRIADLRISKGFEHKEVADATLSTAMHIIGPEALLNALPLNLDPASRMPNTEPRAFLLPLLAQPHPSPLSHFASYFVPLSERMFDLQQKAEIEGRQSEAKVWNVLVGQVWTGLAGYCSGPNLKQSLDSAFSQLLSQLLYGQPELRPAILKALKVMVDANLTVPTAIAEDITTSEGLTQQEAHENLEFLRTQTESWLAVLFNVYGSAARDFRGVIGEVISSWVTIAGEQEIHNAYSNVVQLFKTNLVATQNGPTTGSTDNMAATFQDILTLLLKGLGSIDSISLFDLCLSPAVLSGKDNGVQKRGYKILTRLVVSGKVPIDAETILRKLDDLTEGLTPAARKDRFGLLAALIDLLPSTSLHVVPSLLPEAVLGTKEPSEKARSAAFEVILALGRKMSSGGVVKRSMVDGMDEDKVEDTAASIEEFMTMVAGGLAGTSAHMISATVTAISRLVFEFKHTISGRVHNEILSTMLVFLPSTNREIVKSVLGFVKLVIHTLPTDLVRPHLKVLVPALLSWSHDHKNHFKVKVRHIFERMLRRFTWEEIYSCAEEEDASKVLINIKKRKERAKRKKTNREQEDEGADEIVPSKVAAGDAFEDVLYGSQSELDDSDDEGSVIATGNKKKNIQDVRLRLDDDEPMDLLEGAAIRITDSNSKHRRKPGQDASHFKTDAESGKIVIDDSDSDNETNLREATDIAGTAYRENITSVDGFTRGPNGKIKFNKDTRKRRLEEASMEDVEMADVDESTPKSKKIKRKKSEVVKLGHEFKAKKAGGDIKKGGVDPFAYMSLSQAAKNGGPGRHHVGITGKR